MGDEFQGDNSGYIDFADSGDSSGGYDIGVGGDSFAIDYAPYDPNALESQLNEPDYLPSPDNPTYSSFDLFQDYLDYYTELGYDPLTAASLAAQDAEGGTYQLEGS